MSYFCRDRVRPSFLALIMTRRSSEPRLPDGKIFLGLRPHALHPGAIQGKEGIKICHLATLISINPQPEKKKSYSPYEVRELEARLSAKKRGLATNAKMLEQRGPSLPDGGAKLRLCIDKIKVHWCKSLTATVLQGDTSG